MHCVWPSFPPTWLTNTEQPKKVFTEMDDDKIIPQTATGGNGKGNQVCVPRHGGGDMNSSVAVFSRFSKRCLFVPSRTSESERPYEKSKHQLDSIVNKRNI